MGYSFLSTVIDTSIERYFPFKALHVLLLSLLSLSLFHSCQAGFAIVNKPNVNWDYQYPYQPSPLHDSSWHYGSATWYDFIGNSGACGQPWSVINSIDYAATPSPRWNNFMTAGVGSFGGAACGQCYHLKCLGQPRYGRKVFCNKNAKAVTVRITDFDTPGRPGGWPNNHFDLKPATFARIADKSAGIINIKWKRVPCPRMTPKWALASDSNGYYHELIVYNVPDVGSIVAVWVKPPGSRSWLSTKRSWGTHFFWLGFGSPGSSTGVRIQLAEGRGFANAKYHQTS
eukprot:TRINITY_DN15076_c0_g5_i1.p1 TRINITY_DN15076_c0_g5~~TRINITY_DN15076_c0_g5_i1.p1  ORF type:complete len:286 (-),score=2.71 TRINITY_DN15076_c0_g5_i1:376-1233(-)